MAWIWPSWAWKPTRNSPTGNTKQLRRVGSARFSKAGTRPRPTGWKREPRGSVFYVLPCRFTDRAATMASLHIRKLICDRGETRSQRYWIAKNECTTRNNVHRRTVRSDQPWTGSGQWADRYHLGELALVHGIRWPEPVPSRTDGLLPSDDYPHETRVETRHVIRGNGLSAVLATGRCGLDVRIRKGAGKPPFLCVAPDKS